MVDLGCLSYFDPKKPTIALLACFLSTFACHAPLVAYHKKQENIKHSKCIANEYMMLFCVCVLFHLPHTPYPTRPRPRPHRGSSSRRSARSPSAAAPCPRRCAAWSAARRGGPTQSGPSPCASATWSAERCLRARQVLSQNAWGQVPKGGSHPKGDRLK